MNMAKTEEGCTALHIAAMHCQKAIVDFLLKKGANVKAVDALGRTPLDVAGQAAAEPDQGTPYSPYSMPTTYSSPLPTTYSAPTAYSAAMPTAYSASMGPTTYATTMDNFIMPREFFMKPGSSLASSARSLADAKYPAGRSHS